jgi:hypothetical protein
MKRRKPKLLQRRYTPTQLREMRKVSMTLAHSMRIAKKWSMSDALRWAWKLVKNQVTSKIAGVTIGNRQEAIKRLWNYEPRRVVFTLRREKENPFDANAIAVDVTVIGKGTLHMGYIPKDTAEIIAQLLGKNHVPSITEWEIIGEDIRGIKLKMELVAGIAVLNQTTGVDRRYSAMIAIR